MINKNQKIVKMVDGFIYTTAIKRLRKLRKRTRVVPGGTSAGKTFGIIPILIDKAIKTKLLEISIVSETMPHLKKGAIKDFKKIMMVTGRWNPKHWHDSDKKYTFPNGSYIEFFSADDESRVRGPRRNVLYINECNNLKFETYYQLNIRTDQEVWLDYNPTSEFWVDTEVLTDKEDTELLRLTYKDNEALAPSIVKELEKNRIKSETSKYWENWCRVYLDGEIGSLEGVIFSNWKQIDSIPKLARLVGYGMDFGYSNDPTTLTACYLFNGQYYFDELIYQTGLKTRELAALMKEIGVNKNITIFADSADPKTIGELQEYGFSVMGAKKGPDSIKFGIDLLQSVDFFVTKESTNIIRELRAYQWLTDKTGKKLNEPVDLYNHSIDGMRYFAIMKISQRTSGTVGVDYN
jgi:phage terminase large subunit